MDGIVRWDLGLGPWGESQQAKDHRIGHLVNADRILESYHRPGNTMPLTSRPLLNFPA